MGTSYDVVCGGDDRLRWLQERKHGIGASESAVIVGAGRTDRNGNPYTTVEQLLEDKLDIYAISDDVNAYALRGILLEPLVLNRFREDEPRVVAGGALLRSTQTPCMIATPDAWLGDTPVNMKTCKKWQRKAWLNDGPPLYYQIQAQHELYVSGAERALLVVHWVDSEDNYEWVGGDHAQLECLLRISSKVRLDTFPVERNDLFLRRLVTACEQFWARVELGRGQLASVAMQHQAVST